MDNNGNERNIWYGMITLCNLIWDDHIMSKQNKTSVDLSIILTYCNLKFIGCIKIQSNMNGFVGLNANTLFESLDVEQMNL